MAWGTNTPMRQEEKERDASKIDNKEWWGTITRLGGGREKKELNNHKTTLCSFNALKQDYRPVIHSPWFKKLEKLTNLVDFEGRH